MEKDTPGELIYGLNDRPPLIDTLFAAVQHLLAMFVGIITPPLIIASALKFDIETTGFLVSMSLFVSGIATFIQCFRFGMLGCGLLCVQGTSYSFISPIIQAGAVGGLPLIFGCCIAASSVEIFLSFFIRYARRVITPLVSGVVVMMIGLSLIKVGIFTCAGGAIAQNNGTFASLNHLGLAFLVLVSIVLLNIIGNKYIRMSSVILGLLIGATVSYFLGYIDFSKISDAELFILPVPFKYGLDFDISSIIALAFVYFVTMIESYGDITANSIISGEPIEGKLFMKRVSGGVFADGVNSLLAGVFNSFPNSVFAQNNGLIQLTGIASRYVGYFIAGILVLLGLFPMIGLYLSLIPDPVLGGASLLMFGTVAVAGIRILASQTIDRRATFIIAISLGVGLGVELVPGLLTHFPDIVRSTFSSGITAGGITAIVVNLLIPTKID